MPDTVPTVQPVIAGEPTTTEDRADLFGVDGARLARLHLAPPLLAQAAVRRVRDTADGKPPDQGVFNRAAVIFSTGRVFGESPDQYVDRYALSAGVPKPVVRRAVMSLAQILKDVRRFERLDLPPPPELPGTVTRWIPAGRLFTQFIYTGTHPGGNGSWIRALSLGYSVLIRPGDRDPFTPRRLIGALIAAGLPAHKLTLLPGEPKVGHLMLEHSDVGGIWAPPEQLRRWHRHRTVKAHGPARCKVLIDHDPSAAELDYLADLVAGEGGGRCDNVSAILTTSGTDKLAHALAERLATLPAAPVTAETAQLPAVSAERAPAVRKQFADLAAGMVDHTAARYGGDPLTALADGSYAVRPVVLAASSNAHPTVGTELHWPFVTVAPWHPDDGIRPLRETLVLTVMGDDQLLTMVQAEPTIRRVSTGLMLPWKMPHPSMYGDDLILMLATRKVTVTGGGAP